MARLSAVEGDVIMHSANILLKYRVLGSIYDNILIISIMKYSSILISGVNKRK